MKTIEVTDDIYDLLDETMGGAGLNNYSEVIDAMDRMAKIYMRRIPAFARLKLAADHLARVARLSLFHDPCCASWSPESKRCDCINMPILIALETYDIMVEEEKRDGEMPIQR